MSPVITHEIKWTKIPVTGFSFSFSQLLKSCFYSLGCSVSLDSLSRSLCLSLLNGWQTCSQLWWPGSAQKWTAKTVVAGKLKTELSRLLFALFLLMSYVFCSLFCSLVFRLWRVELRANGFCLSASLRRHVKHIWAGCVQCPVTCGLRNWPST